MSEDLVLAKSVSLTVVKPGVSLCKNLRTTIKEKNTRRHLVVYSCALPKSYVIQSTRALHTIHLKLILIYVGITRGGRACASVLDLVFMCLCILILLFSLFASHFCLVRRPALFPVVNADLDDKIKCCMDFLCSKA